MIWLVWALFFINNIPMQFDTPVNLVMLYKMFLNTIYSKVWVSRHLYDTLIYYISYKVKVFPFAVEYATNEVKRNTKSN